MTTIDLLQRLWTATLALGVALVIIAALRIPWRRWFGAEHAFRLWWLPLLALVASQLPHAPAEAVIMRVPVMFAAVAPVPSEPSPVATNMDWHPLLVAVWLLGACVFLLLAVARQWRFLRALRGAERVASAPDGIFEVLRARNDATGPALVGAWRPRLVLPADFEQRYDSRERALILAHEAMHARRHDGLAGAIATTLHALFWFHPLAWWALPRLRRDQELACDAAVLRERPRERRCYANAMLKAQFAGAALPAGSFWPSHPIRERILMLKLPVPDSTRRILGRIAVGGLAIAVSAAAYAAGQRPVSVAAKPLAHAPEYQIAMRIQRSGQTLAAPIVCMKAGGSASIVQEDERDASSLQLQLHLRAQESARDELRVALDGSVRDGGNTSRLNVSLSGPLGKPMSVRMDSAPDTELEILPTLGCTARLAPPPPPPPPPLPPAAPPPPPPPPQMGRIVTPAVPAVAAPAAPAEMPGPHAAPQAAEPVVPAAPAAAAMPAAAPRPALAPVPAGQPVPSPASSEQR